MKKVLVISSSLRRNSNSEQLAVSFADGAKSAGNEVEVISLRDKEIKFCIGCLACQETQRCVMHDDADMIREKMLSNMIAMVQAFTLKDLMNWASGCSSTRIGMIPRK